MKRYILNTQSLMGVDEHPEGYFVSSTDYDAAQARIAALEADIANWKRLYDRRGLALARPCIACGHVPAAIKPMSQSETEGK